MSNSKAKAIQRFYKQAYDHIEAFDKALTDYPTTQTFSIVTTKNPNGFSFVPKHLKRFVVNAMCLGTIDRPRADIPLDIQLMQKSIDMLETLEPEYQFDSLISNILDYEIYENITETFYLINLITRGATTANASYKDQAISVNDSLKSNFVKIASQQLETFKANYKTIDFYNTLADFDINVINNLPRITLDKKPIDKDVIWSWVKKQGLNPDNTNDGETIIKKLINLSINNQAVVGIAIKAAEQTIDNHQNDINKLHRLVLND